MTTAEGLPGASDQKTTAEGLPGASDQKTTAEGLPVASDQKTTAEGLPVASDQKRAFVAILMGSDSDRDIMEKASGALDEFGVEHETNAISAHRKPRALVEYIEGAESRGVAVFICAAGMAAALPGVVAAHTTKPVIGVPIASGGLGGLDALMSIVQMPPNVPVACVAVNGARNAGLLAVQIMAGRDPGLAAKFAAFKEKLAEG